MSDVLEIDKLRRQQSAIADFGTFAIHEHDLQKILSEAARVCAEGLGTKFSKICSYRAMEGELLIVAGQGWKSGLIGKVVYKADASSPQGRAFSTGNPAICENLLEDQTYELPSFYKDHRIISTIDVLIKGQQNPYGVLEVDSDVFLVFDQHYTQEKKRAKTAGAEINTLNALACCTVSLSLSFSVTGTGS